MLSSDSQFEGHLGAFNGLPPRNYIFQRVQCKEEDSNLGSRFSNVMINGCSNLGYGTRFFFVLNLLDLYFCPFPNVE